jgi:hypothetical protein
VERPGRQVLAGRRRPVLAAAPAAGRDPGRAPAIGSRATGDLRNGPFHPVDDVGAGAPSTDTLLPPDDGRSELATTVVEDCWGDRWTVRARRERWGKVDSDYNRRRDEPALRERLGPALAPRPEHPAAGDAPSWLAEIDLARLRRVLRPFGIALGSITNPSPRGLFRTLIALDSAVQSLIPAPAGRYWVVELAGAGRTRRGATWKVSGPDEAARVAGIVADAVQHGQVPRPGGALLIHVVDHRLTVHGTPR